MSAPEEEEGDSAVYVELDTAAAQHPELAPLLRRAMARLLRLEMQNASLNATRGSLVPKRRLEEEIANHGDTRRVLDSTRAFLAAAEGEISEARQTLRTFDPELGRGCLGASIAATMRRWNMRRAGFDPPDDDATPPPPP